MTEATEAVIFVAVILTLACAIFAAIVGTMRDAPSKPPQQSYRRHRPWNFK